MELVKGVPITRYCDKHRLTIRERLELFIPICHAIQHAHQKGIIHRDIKPSNVLVSLYDGQPVPKVIDFGIAKAIEQKLTQRTLFTEFGQVIGTLEYMSPEQAELNQLDIDTRSDVYSLGVLLYELLTGTTPFTKEQLCAAGYEEMLRTIREVDPPTPSKRLSQLTEVGDARPQHSAFRILHSAFDQDLDWIVMKALEKDRARRYETANNLAADLQRFLRHEAVEACPPSPGYKFRKLARRNRSLIATAASIAVLLVVATVVSSLLAVWAWRAEEVARNREEDARNAARAESIARMEEQAQRKQAVASAKRAEREAIRSSLVAELLKEMLQGVGPSVARGRDPTLLKEILLKTAQRVEGGFEEHPEVEVELRGTLADAYRALGDYARAETMAREVLRIQEVLHGHESSEVAHALGRIGVLFQEQGRYREAEAMHRTALNMWTTVHTQCNHVVTSLTSLGYTLLYSDNAGDAEELLRQALGLDMEINGHEHVSVAQSLHHLAHGLEVRGKLDESADCYGAALAMQQRLTGPRDPKTLKFAGCLAGVLARLGRDRELEDLLREALATKEMLQENVHPDVATMLVDMARALQVQGNSAEAQKLLAEGLAMQRKVLGDAHPHLLLSYRQLDLFHGNRLYSEQAEAAARMALARSHQEFREEHVEVARAAHNLAHTIAGRDPVEAEQLFRRSYKMQSGLVGSDDPETQMFAKCLERHFASHRPSGELGVEWPSHAASD